MEITEIRIKLMDDPQERLQAFCSITFDGCFVIRDLKIIEGTKGSFVAMPSRKLTDRCPGCNTKNHLRSLFCNQCGAKLKEDRAPRDDAGRAKLYADIAHPINSRCREMIQSRVIHAFGEELERAKLPGYICSYDDYGEESYADLDEMHDTVAVRTVSHRLDAASGPPAPHNGNGAPHLGNGHGSVATNRLREPAVALARDHGEPFGDGIL